MCAMGLLLTDVTNLSPVMSSYTLIYQLELEGEAPDTVSKPGNHEGLPLRIVSQYTETPIKLCL